MWWAFLLTGVATVFFYARLWRRSGVMTDLEFYEIRYSGKAASVVRGFRAVYLGLFFNCMIMATVNLAACKIADILFGLERWQTLLFVGVLNVVFAAHSGLWGVLVIDMIQFFIKMTAVIAAAYFALQAPQVGGLHALVDKLSTMRGPDGHRLPELLPDFTNNWDIAVAVFIMPIAVQWWAVWYPGAEPGGGSYIAQRMLASKSEKDALGAVLFFNVAHYVLRPWPWILVGALLDSSSTRSCRTSRRAFPHLDPKLLGHDIAYPGDAEVPAGRLRRADGRRAHRRELVDDPHAPELGRVVSRARFLPPLHQDRRRREALRAGGPARDGRCCSSARRALVFLLDTAKDAFDIILQIGAGTGLLYLRALVLVAGQRVVRSRGDGQLVRRLDRSFLVLAEERHRVQHAQVALILTVADNDVCWVVDGVCRSAETDRQVLDRLLQEGPAVGPGWEPIRVAAGVTERDVAATGDNIPMALVGWVAGLHGDLVGAVHSGQRALRSLGVRHRPLRRLSRQRDGAAARDSHAVGGLERELTDP